MTRVLLASALLALCGCDKKQIWCQKEAEAEGRARRCQLSKDGCEKYLALRKGGCASHDQAWCFLEKPMGDLDAELVCAATQADCTSWRRVRKKYEPTECKLTPASAM